MMAPFVIGPDDEGDNGQPLPRPTYASLYPWLLLLLWRSCQAHEMVAVLSFRGFHLRGIIRHHHLLPAQQEG